MTLTDPLLVAFYTALLSLFTPWIWYQALQDHRAGRLGLDTAAAVVYP